MAYLPDPAPLAPPRFSMGSLARWVREAVIDLSDYDQARVNLRLEVLYARRRATRKPFEPVADLARETHWLLEALGPELKALGIPGAGNIRARVRASLLAWEGGED